LFKFRLKVLNGGQNRRRLDFLIWQQEVGAEEEVLQGLECQEVGHPDQYLSLQLLVEELCQRIEAMEDVQPQKPPKRRKRNRKLKPPEESQ
jgi:hypothetical protein